MHSSENRAADAALALKNTGTGSGTENATATIDHPDRKPSTGLKITFRRFQSKFPGLKLSQLVPYATAMLSTKFQS